MRKSLRLIGYASTALAVLTSACASHSGPPVNIAGLPGKPLDMHGQSPQNSAVDRNASTGANTRTSDGPLVPGASIPAPAASEKEPAAAPKNIKPIRISFEAAPIPAFINAVFAETLGFAVRLDPAIAQKTETITLKTGDPVSGKDMFNIAAAALRDYGVEVVVDTPRTLRFTTADRQRAGTPMVFRGGAIRNTGSGDAPLYYLYSLRATSMNALTQMLSASFGGRIQITGSPSENAVLLSGPPSVIESALNIISSFDQPRMSGKMAKTIQPVFFTPTRMAEGLARVLRAAGYNVSTTPDAAAINIVPLDEVGVIIVYAIDDNAQAFALDWARRLDQPGAGGEQNQAFVYFIQNTDADSVASVLQSALGGATQTTRANGAAPSSAASLSGSAVQPQPLLGAQNPSQGANPGGPPGQIAGFQAAGLRVAVDPGRNALIFMGNAEQYGAMLPLLRQLDRAPGEVLIEVVLAEVTETDASNLGMEYGIGNKAKTGEFNLSGGTRGGLGVGGGGLTLNLLSPTTNAQVIINALSNKSKVNVLSNPRVVAKSGTPAKIQVGTQVPVLRQQSQNSGFGQNGIVNSVDYIDTGVVLNVKPVIRSDQRVDLEVAQEVSEAQTNTTSSISSPLIFTRSISTQLSLHDGQTVLLGGLKSQNHSNGRVGIPGLSGIPGIGNLFSSQSGSVRDTELLIFITPYIVSDPQVADAIATRYRDTMQKWADVSGSLTW